MPLPSFPAYIPVWASPQADFQSDVDIANFGDGYEQRSASGLNAIQQAGSYEFNLTHADADILQTFLETNGVTGFQFQPPGQALAKNFKCLNWSRRKATPLRTRMTIGIEQIFDLV